jgi:DNA-binding transcriptional LysR family regulator
MELAPSTVSEQIKRFEESHGIKLFHRRGRELSLTDEGERIFEYANQMFERGKRLEDELTHNDVSGYTVKVGLESSLENTRILDFLSKYWTLYSSFGLVETKRSKNLSQSIYFLENDVIDWFVTSTPFKDERFDQAALGKYQYSFYCAKQIFSKFREKGDILHNLPLGKLSSNEEVANKIKNYLLTKSISPKEIFSCDHQELLLNLCRQGEIVLLLPELFDGEYTGLKKIDLGETLDFELYAVFKKVNAQLLYMRKLYELTSSLNIRPAESAGPVNFSMRSMLRPIDVIRPNSLN